MMTWEDVKKHFREKFLKNKWWLIPDLLTGLIMIVFTALAPINWVLQGIVYFALFAMPPICVVWAVEKVWSGKDRENERERSA